jgi:GT2 family glycosyltransferase
MNGNKEPRFSLIMATVERTNEVKRFLKHLDCQTYPEFELIVVDQNPDDRLVPLLEPYRDRFPILRLRSKRGVSRARNVGLRHVSGNIIAFPDDDCWYPSDLLERVARFFQNHSDIHGLSGRTIDEQQRPVGRWDKRAGLINRYNVWWRAKSCTIFLRAELVQTVGYFDETLGLGAGTPWGAAEETDYLLRALKHGQRLFYCPNLTVFHPQPRNDRTIDALNRVREYAQGVGRVLRKHRFPAWYLPYRCCLTLLKSFYLFMLGRFTEGQHCLVSIRGRITGWKAEP